MTAVTDTCAKCGKALTPMQIQRSREYCSRDCFNDVRWGEKICFGSIETRRPLVIAAAKLCQMGLTQTEAARQLDLPIWQIADWVRRYGAENFVSGRVCGHCGKSFAGMRPLSNRKYCSQLCKYKAGYARNRAPSPSSRQRRKFDPALRAQALEMYWDGQDQTEIARQLGVVSDTVCSWTHKFGNLRERRMPARHRLREAQNAGEWQQALREAAPPADTPAAPVRLVCGGIHGHCGMNQLGTIITEALHQNSFGGETYAFSNMERKTIYTITWKQALFHIAQLPKMHGSYVWPREEFGPFIEVAQTEFEHLISFCKRPAEAQKNLDLSRFS